MGLDLPMIVRGALNSSSLMGYSSGRNIPVLSNSNISTMNGMFGMMGVPGGSAMGGIAGAALGSALGGGMGSGVGGIAGGVGGLGGGMSSMGGVSGLGGGVGGLGGNALGGMAGAALGAAALGGMGGSMGGLGGGLGGLGGGMLNNNSMVGSALQAAVPGSTSARGAVMGAAGAAAVAMAATAVSAAANNTSGFGQNNYNNQQNYNQGYNNDQNAIPMNISEPAPPSVNNQRGYNVSSNGFLGSGGSTQGGYNTAPMQQNQNVYAPQSFDGSPQNMGNTNQGGGINGLMNRAAGALNSFDNSINNAFGQNNNNNAPMPTGPVSSLGAINGSTAGAMQSVNGQVNNPYAGNAHPTDLFGINQTIGGQQSNTPMYNQPTTTQTIGQQNGFGQQQQLPNNQQQGFAQQQNTQPANNQQNNIFAQQPQQNRQPANTQQNNIFAQQPQQNRQPANTQQNNIFAQQPQQNRQPANNQSNNIFGQQSTNLLNSPAPSNSQQPSPSLFGSSGSAAPAAAQPKPQIHRNRVPMSGKLLSKGQKYPLKTDQGTPLTRLFIGLGWDIKDPRCELDVSAFMLGENEKVVSEECFVFYGNPKSPDNSMTYSTFSEDPSKPDDAALEIDLSKVDPRVQKIALAVTIYEASEQRLNFSMTENVYARIVNKDNNTEFARFEQKEGSAQITALVLGELYRHKGEWKWNSVGSGVMRDLAGFCGMYGVELE
ncbi:MAG: TerD family protein [Oscillospiraceae bacterium]|nr:TerD family protein [Oscillospiraceae bacterium]